MKSCLHSSLDRSSRTRRASSNCNAIGSQSWSPWPSPSSRRGYVSDPDIPGCRMLMLPSHRRKNTRFTTRRRSCSLGSLPRMDTRATQTSSRNVSSSRVEGAPKGCTVRKWRCIAHFRPDCLSCFFCIGLFTAIGWLPPYHSLSGYHVLFRSDWPHHAKRHVREGNGGIHGEMANQSKLRVQHHASRTITCYIRTIE
jgi:hypothetical protein